jgi:hypothetical protein
VLVTGRDVQRAASVVPETESGGGTAAYRLTALDGVQQARDLAAWAEKAGDGRTVVRSQPPAAPSSMPAASALSSSGEPVAKAGSATSSADTAVG